MKNIIQIARYMNKFDNIMIIKFKIFNLKKMFNIFKIAGDQVIHSNHMITFFYKPVTKM